MYNYSKKITSEVKFPSVLQLRNGGVIEHTLAFKLGYLAHALIMNETGWFNAKNYTKGYCGFRSPKKDVMKDFPMLAPYMTAGVKYDGINVIMQSEQIMLDATATYLTDRVVRLAKANKLDHNNLDRLSIWNMMRQAVGVWQGNTNTTAVERVYRLIWKEDVDNK